MRVPAPTEAGAIEVIVGLRGLVTADKERTRIDRELKRIEKDLAAGQIDAAIVWGPIAGYFAKRVKSPKLRVVPLKSEPGVRFDYPDLAAKLYPPTASSAQIPREAVCDTICQAAGARNQSGQDLRGRLTVPQPGRGQHPGLGIHDAHRHATHLDRRREHLPDPTGAGPHTRSSTPLWTQIEGGKVALPALSDPVHHGPFLRRRIFVFISWGPSALASR